MTFIASDDLCRWLQRFCDLLESTADELTRLDSAIGDADHGANMERGVDAIRRTIDGKAGRTPATLLADVGEAVLEGTGGAAGPLYASLFLGAAPACDERAELAPSEFAEAVRAGVANLATRGRAEIGDKTMYDAAHPAAEALVESAASGSDVSEIMRAAATAARSGRDATEPLQARKGRASYLGPRSVGHIDPGAASVTLLFEALDALVEEETR